MFLIIAFFCAAAIDIAGGFKEGAATRWDRGVERFGNYRTAVKERRSPRGHVRVRDWPIRAGLASIAGTGGAFRVIGSGTRSGWRRRHQILADWLDRHDRKVPARLQRAFDKRGVVPTPKPVDEPTPEAEQPKTDGKPDAAKPADSATPAGGGAIPMPSGPTPAPSNVTPIRPNLTNPTPTPTPAAAPATTGGTTMSETNSLEQLKATLKAVSDAAQVEINDAQADVQRAKDDLTNIQRVHEQVKARWNEQQAAPYGQMVEDGQVKVNAKVGALAAAEQRMASVRAANTELAKLIAADEQARNAGYKRGLDEVSSR